MLMHHCAFVSCTAVLQAPQPRKQRLSVALVVAGRCCPRRHQTPLHCHHQRHCAMSTVMATLAVVLLEMEQMVQVRLARSISIHKSKQPLLSMASCDLMEFTDE
jgi:hypothetical protein